MHVWELINILRNMPEDAEVRIAHQPQWPFEYSIGDVVLDEAPEIVTREAFDAMSEEEQENVMRRADEGEVLLLDEGQDVPASVVYIGEGSQLGYLSGGVSRQLGWR